MIFVIKLRLKLTKE